MRTTTVTTRKYSMTSRPALRRGMPAALLAAVLIAAPLSATSAAAVDATITGSVTEDDAPVGRVEVSAYRWDGDQQSYVFEQATETGSDGSWALDFLPDGAYTLQYDTSVSNARFALGESLGGNSSYADDRPAFEITDGVSDAAPFAEHDLERWGGEITLSITEGGETLIDLDDAVAHVRGIDVNGAPSESQREYADEEGEITIPRVPAGGYVPWVAARGEAAAPAPQDALVFAGASVDFGSIPLGTAPDGEFAADQPTIAGEARSGETLTVVDPAFDPDPESVSHRWSAGERALESTSTSLGLTDELVGESVTAWVFAHGTGTSPFVSLVTSDAVLAADEDPDAAAAAGGAGSGSDAAGSSAADGADAGGASSGSADASASDAAGDASGAAAGTQAEAASDADAASGGAGEPGDGSLPVTGAGIAGLVALAAALLAAGGILVARRRQQLGTE